MKPQNLFGITRFVCNPAYNKVDDVKSSIREALLAMILVDFSRFKF